MDTGQIMAVMQQMPAGVAAPQTGEGVLSLDQAGGAFAGLLQGMTLQKGMQAAVGQGVPLGTPEQIAAPGIMNDAMAALLTITGNNEKQGTAVGDHSTETGSAGSSLPDKTDPESQNVMLALNGAQLTLLLNQLQGRMPEVGVTTGSSSGGALEIPQTDRGINAVRNSADQVQIATSATAAGPADSLRPDGATAVPANVPDLATIIAGQKPLVTPHSEVAVTEGDDQTSMKLREVTRSVAAPQAIPAEGGGRQPEPSSVQVQDSLRVVTESQRRQESAVMRGPELVVEQPVSSAITSLQQSAVVEQDVAATGNRVLQSEQPVNQGRVATLSLAPAAAGALLAPLQNNELPDASAAQQPGLTGQQEQLQKVRSANQSTSLSAVADSSVDARPETVSGRLDQHDTGKTQQSERVDTAKIIASEPAGEKQNSSNEDETPDRGMNGNFQLQVLHQQVKTEGSVTASNASGPAQNDTSRAAVAPEQVVQQVKDHFVNHETKPGSEQIVLRLSPEHLGELKVNLNLDGQRLKVEIVAENKMVRDSLMLHTDALKESLARQNIKMESFDVTTGGNSSTGSGHGQGDWRELAQRRQQNAWMPDGGYRLAKQEVPNIAAYQQKSEHTMVDLHF